MLGSEKHFKPSRDRSPGDSCRAGVRKTRKLQVPGSVKHRAHWEETPICSHRRRLKLWLPVFSFAALDASLTLCASNYSSVKWEKTTFLA